MWGCETGSFGWNRSDRGRRHGGGRAKTYREQNRRRSISRLEWLEERALLTVLTGSGGQGGTTQHAPLDPGLNLVRAQWQNYTIPDEFQVQYQGQRIIGDVGLQSGGHQGTKVVTAHSSSDQLTVKVTAPLQGTAWDFTVEVLPFELNENGF